jgi:HK97 family phage major capsid protein
MFKRKIHKRQMVVAIAVVSIVVLCAIGYLDPLSLAMAGSMGLGIVTVTKTAEELADKQRQRASLHDRSVALFEESESLQDELETLTAKENPTAEDTARVKAIKERLASVETEYKATEERIDKLTAEISGVQTRLNRANSLNAREGAIRVPQATQAQTNQVVSHVRIEAAEPTKEQNERDIADFVKCAAASGGIPQLALSHASDVLGNERLRNAMEAGSFSGGGFVVPPNYMPTLIGLLSAKAVIRRMLGGSTVPLVNGSMTVPRMTSGASASYVGEGENIATTSLAGGQLTLVGKELAAIVPVSNKLLRISNPSADAMIRNELIRALALKEDVTFIRGAGTGVAPKGLRYWAPSANVLTMTSTPTLATVTSDLGKLELALTGSDVDLVEPAWIMPPRIKTYLKDLRDSNGNRAWPELDGDMLRGYPVFTTTQVPINLGGGTESELYFVESSEIILATDESISIDASNTAAYHDGSAVVAAFSKNQTVIRAIESHDFAPKHVEAIAVLTGVTWGA